MESLQSAWSWFNDLMAEHGDRRVEGWLMMSGPLPTAVVCLSYVFIVKVLGPWFMRDRKPYDLRSLIVVYNLLQTLFSIWLFKYVLFAGWVQKYSLRCQPVDYSDDPMAVRMVHASWWYYMSKFSEFFDTFFFVLRKKFEHVSTLHVVHHGIMPMSVWFGVKFTPGGHSTFFGLVNTFVHIVMYFYYMVAAMGPKYHKYLWWKKYLTGLQMVQFVMIIAHAFQLLIYECDYPKAFVWFIGGHAVLFFFLFLDFFKKAYVERPSKSASLEPRVGGRDGVKLSRFIPCVMDVDHVLEESRLMNGDSHHGKNGVTSSIGPQLRPRTKGTNGVANGTTKWEE